jgi:hypothetical protein
MSDKKLSDAELQQWRDNIDKMSQMQMASLQRFAPSGHPVFDSQYPLYDYFQEKFKEKGGMTPSVSKSIGWDAPKF